jgi:hypothetical protein
MSSFNPVLGELNMIIRETYPLALLLSVVLATGCNSKTDGPAAESHQEEAGHTENDGHAEHDHPTTGPHGGELIELGNEEYHAELTHENEAIVFLLDGSAKAAAPSDASEVTINLSHDGKGEQFRLTASRDTNDPEGKSSRFTSNDAELLKDLQEGHAEVALVVTINGKQYRGNLEHEHGEEGHDH